MFRRNLLPILQGKIMSDGGATSYVTARSGRTVKNERKAVPFTNALKQHSGICGPM